MQKSVRIYKCFGQSRSRKGPRWLSGLSARCPLSLQLNTHSTFQKLVSEFANKFKQMSASARTSRLVLQSVAGSHNPHAIVFETVARLDPAAAARYQKLHIELSNGQAGAYGTFRHPGAHHTLRPHHQTRLVRIFTGQGKRVCFPKRHQQRFPVLTG